MVLMPLRAFVDSDGSYWRSMVMEGGTVLMPLRAFVDSDEKPISASKIIGCVLMPLRAFVDSD